MRAYLSGMPECKFGLNDKVLLEKEGKLGTSTGTTPGGRRTAGAVELDDCQFHQCVKLGNFERDRTINFIPPDGECELMKYRTTENINLPFRVHAVVIEVSKNRMEFKVSVRSQFTSKIFAQNVQLKVPVPTNTSGAKCLVTAGKAKYVGSENAIVWK